MNLNNLKKIQKTRKRRLGQGHGSGRGKTAGRGTKGQLARGKIKLSFEGGALPLIKRLPFTRGKGRNKARVSKTTLNVGDLNKLSPKTVVTKELLVSKGFIDAKDAKNGIKILGNGTLTVALTISVSVSKNALKKIEKAGGTHSTGAGQAVQVQAT